MVILVVEISQKLFQIVNHSRMIWTHSAKCFGDRSFPRTLFTLKNDGRICTDVRKFDGEANQLDDMSFLFLSSFNQIVNVI